jgi:hypothetical protein
VRFGRFASILLIVNSVLILVNTAYILHLTSYILQIFCIGNIQSSALPGLKKSTLKS